MRVQALHWRPYSLPLHRPFVAAWGRLTQREGLLLSLRDDLARWGHGEAAPLPGYGGEPLHAAQACLEHLARQLPGRDIPPPGDAALDLFLDGLLAEVGGTHLPTTRHALEQALLHLWALERGQPPSTLLHPNAGQSVAVNATLGAEDTPTLLTQAEAALTAGFATLKIKVGATDVAADTARLHALRGHVGPGVALRADANGAWTPAQARQALAEWAGLGLEYVEQPLPPGELDALRLLAQVSPVPIALDEQIDHALMQGGARGLDMLLELEGIACWVLKPMLLGGMGRTCAWARRAMGAGVSVVVTTTLEGAVGRAGALHTALAVEAIREEVMGGQPAQHQPDLPPRAHGLATGGIFPHDLVEHPALPTGGRLGLEASLGLPTPAPPFHPAGD